MADLIPGKWYKVSKSGTSQVKFLALSNTTVLLVTSTFNPQTNVESTVSSDVIVKTEFDVDYLDEIITNNP